MAPGLKRIYRRGRKAMDRAADDPRDEHLHELRKRSKDLWYSAQILRPAGPKPMKKLARRAHRLADALGDDHDLAELRRYACAHADCFDSSAAQATLLEAIDRRRSKLQKKAFDRGARIYRRRPRRFVSKIARRWHEQAMS
jgi:CHAD domain-containing protein